MKGLLKPRGILWVTYPKGTSKALRRTSTGTAFIDNPLRMSTIVVVEAGGRVIGCSHNIYFNLKLGGRNILGMRGLSLAIYPDFRGRGIFTEMDVLRKDMQASFDPGLYFWLSTNPITIDKALREGYKRFPKPIANFIRIKDFDKHIKKRALKNALLKKYGVLLLKASSKLKRIPDLKINADKDRGNINVSDVNEFNDRFDSFWNSIIDHYKFIAVKNRKKFKLEVRR